MDANDREDDHANEPNPDADRAFDDMVDPPFNPVTGSTGYSPQFFGYPPVEPSSSPPQPPSSGEPLPPMSTASKLGCVVAALAVAVLLVLAVRSALP